MLSVSFTCSGPDGWSVVWCDLISSIVNKCGYIRNCHQQNFTSSVKRFAVTPRKKFFLWSQGLSYSSRDGDRQLNSVERNLGLQFDLHGLWFLPKVDVIFAI